ncbi:MAG TPA: type II toxin-antitoxin system VapC family toxin [Candidatus Limnocylindrales bacterium]
MTLVLDASVLSEYLVGSPAGHRVAAMLSGDPDDLHIPHLAVVETASALRRWVRGGHTTSALAEAALHDLTDFPATRWPAEPFLPRIWELRDSLTAYDATYVALAESLDATLVTSDARLARGAEGRTRCRIIVVAPVD